MSSSTSLHEERLDVVSRLLADSGAETVLDIGCGSGGLLERLIGVEQFTKVVGLDSSIAALGRAERRLNDLVPGAADRLSLIHGSFTDPHPELKGFDAAALVETIEHIPAKRLSRVEQVVFGDYRPGLVVITTPNSEYNVRFGIPEGEFRHPEHEFEWSRARFRKWGDGLAERNGYSVEYAALGPREPVLGSPSQMAIFRAGKP